MGKYALCEHKRQRSRCKECGGTSFCEHGRRRSSCKEYGGTSICDHGRRRSRCKECGGTSICKHGKRRSLCKECGGASVPTIQKAQAKIKATHRARVEASASILSPATRSLVGPAYDDATIRAIGHFVLQKKKKYWKKGTRHAIYIFMTSVPGRNSSRATIEEQVLKESTKTLCTASKTAVIIAANESPGAGERKVQASDFVSVS